MAFGLNLFGRISLNAAPFEQGLRGITRTTESAGARIASSLKGQIAAVLGARAIANYTKNLIDYGSALKDTSTALGISTTELQKFQYAAKQSGASAESIERAFKELSKSRLEALKNPKGDDAQAFAALGLSEDALRNGTLESIFRKIADTVRTTDFGAGEDGLLSKVLGRGGQELIPAFIAGLEEAGQRAADIGAILDEGVVDGLKAASDQLTDISAKLKGPFADALMPFLAMINKTVDGLRFMGGYLSDLFGAMSAGEGQWHQRIIHAQEFAESELKRRVNEAAGLGKSDIQTTGPATRTRKAFEFTSGGGASKMAEVQMKALSPLTDSLISVGNFLGSDPNRGIGRQLDEVKRYLRDIKENTGRNNGSSLSFPL